MVKNILIIVFLFSSIIYANSNNGQIENKISSLEKPLYNPFVENYILHEIKILRDENRNLEVDLHETLAKKEVEISNNAISYATSTINNMFYILAAATSLLVIIGWTSVRDMNDKIKAIVDQKVSKVIDDYEQRMNIVEEDLRKRSKQVLQNQRDIEKTNIIHSLWMRVSQETTLHGKVDIYNEILEHRPEDVEAIIFKADTVLDLGEANWSLNLTNQALQIDKNYADAYYQRAKVYCVLGYLENGIEDIEKAVELNEQYISEIEQEEKFKVLLKDKKIKYLLARLV
jgi:tetratricopeptide (TPR) repeat protein